MRGGGGQPPEMPEKKRKIGEGKEENNEWGNKRKGSEKGEKRKRKTSL